MCLAERKEKTSSEWILFGTYFKRNIVFSVWVKIWGINQNYMYRKEKTFGERNNIRFVLHTENSIFSKAKNMGKKRFSGFVPNHRNWGECWDSINTILTYVEILLNISKSFEILLNISKRYWTTILLVLKISIN